jgi:uncharacterized membrane protein YagU involved in acid resistance
MDNELTTAHRGVRKRPARAFRSEAGRLTGMAPLRGAAAGALATAPMTLFIYAVDRVVPHEERHELPPRQITRELAERSGTNDEVGKTGLDLTSSAAHFAFGAATGAIYGSIAGRIPLPPALAGAAFGLGVWTASYAGALPSLGLQRPPESRPAWRTATMVAGHLVWGAALGWAEALMRTAGEADRRRRGVAYPEPEVVGPALEIGDRPW